MTPRPRLKKGLGQHHLLRSATCGPLVDFMAPRGERILEIGPGGGVLTSALLEAGGRVTAIELDPEWAVALRSRRLDRLSLILGDALEFEYSRLLTPTLVTGNLPYNVGTGILTRVLPHHERVPRAGFLVQLEVAQRLTASPCTRAYGSLSVFAQVYSSPKILSRVPPSAFRPPPKVESAFVGFDLRAPPLPQEELAGFEGLVRQGFAHKRKTLRNALSHGLGREVADGVLLQAGFDARVRAEELPLEQWLVLNKAFQAFQ